MINQTVVCPKCGSMNVSRKSARLGPLGWLQTIADNLGLRFKQGTFVLYCKACGSNSVISIL